MQTLIVVGCRHFACKDFLSHTKLIFGSLLKLLQQGREQSSSSFWYILQPGGLWGGHALDFSFFFSNPSSVRDPPVAVEFGPHSDPGESESDWLSFIFWIWNLMHLSILSFLFVCRASHKNRSDQVAWANLYIQWSCELSLIYTLQEKPVLLIIVDL